MISIRTPRRRLVLFLTLVGPAGALSRPGIAAAQAVSGSVGRGWSAYDRVPSPTMARVELRSFHVAGVSLRIGLRRGWDRVVGEGTTCDVGWPAYEGCEDEPIRTDLTLTSRWLGLAYRHLRGPRFLEVGVRRTRHELDGDVRGMETGRAVFEVIPGGPFDEWGLDVSVGSLVGGSGSLAWKVTYSFDPTDFSACATDVGAPFCDRSSAFHTLSVGLEFGVG